MKHHFYRLQQRLSLTHSESLALVVVFGLFVFGLGVREVQRRAQPIPPDAYAETDRLFAELSASLADTAQAATVAAPPDTADGGQPAAPGRLDLNAASAADLERLPRIGPKMAERILSYRTAHGPFRRVEDLIQVRGIGAKTLSLITPHVYVAGDPPSGAGGAEE